MATLAAKYGPAAGLGSEALEAAGRLEAYTRAAQAALEARDGPLRALVLLLADEQLAGLFAPRQLAALVTRPLARAAHACT